MSERLTELSRILGNVLERGAVDDESRAALAQIERLAAAGALAGALAGGLADPLARVKQALAETCDMLDRFVATSRGPDPLPRLQTMRIRELVADAFMDVSRSARLAADLAAVAKPAQGGATTADVNDAVERAVALASHRFGDDLDLRLDLGTLPQIACDAARLAQAIAHLLLDAADAQWLHVSTRADDADVIVKIEYAPAPADGATFAALIRDTIAAQGGRLSVSSLSDGAQAEIRLSRG
jgi:signal transduction histidine kinase